MIRRPPRSTRTDTLFPYTTLFRSDDLIGRNHHLGLVKQRLGQRFQKFELPEIERCRHRPAPIALCRKMPPRSEEHTSELQSLMRISYAVFCLKKKKKNYQTTNHNRIQLYTHTLNIKYTHNKL